MFQAQRGTDSVMLPPQLLAGNASAITANLDTQGSDYASIRLTFASEANTDAIGPTISILDSDDTVVTNFATIVADRVGEDLTAARALTYHIDLLKRKRYLRLSLLPETHTTNDDIVIAVEATLTRKDTTPSAETSMADAAVLV